MDNIQNCLKEAIKVSIFVGVVVGIVIGVKTIFEQNLITGIKEGLSACVFIFFLSAVIILLINLILKNHYPAKQTLELNIDYGKSFNTCIESLKLFENTNILINEYSKGKIIAKVDNSSQIILFDIKTISDEVTQVKVSSKPSVYLLAYAQTFSRNKETVNKIIQFLDKKNNEIFTHESPRISRRLWE